MTLAIIINKKKGENTMALSLQQVKTVDVHCHPYVANEKPFNKVEFLNELSLSVSPDMFKEKNYSQSFHPGMNMYMQITIRRLATFLSCESTIEAVVQKRNEMAIDFPAYTKSLFKDVQLEGLLVDFGYPQPSIPKETYEAITGVNTWEVSRIEPIMDSLKEECSTFDNFIEKYRQTLKENLDKDQVFGLKSIIAYRSGLDIGGMHKDIAAKQYDEFQKKGRAKAKELRDYCLHIALEECTKTNKVLHIHTGVGDGEVILSKASPSLLIDVLRDKRYKDTKVHLVHGGYPWMEEAAFMASILPNVYMDISLQNPFIGHGVERIISQVFEFAPFNKVMYGSDAFTLPEMNWLGVLLFKECFEKVLHSWIKNDYMDSEMAQMIGEMVLYRNFESVYGEDLARCKQ